MSDVEETVWLAGLLEGDGSFLMSKNGKDCFIPRIKISMLDEDVIEKVASIFGSTVTKSLTPKGDKVMFTTSIAKASIVEPMLKSLYPFMGKRRKQQIEIMFEYFKGRLPSQTLNIVL